MYKKNRYKFSIRTYWNAELQVNNRNEGKKALFVKKKVFYGQPYQESLEKLGSKPYKE